MGFNPGGGYAALVQQSWRFDETGVSGVPPNAPLGGVEIIRYSGFSGNTLQVAARGDVVANELPLYGELDPENDPWGGVRVYVFNWENTVDRQGDLLESRMDFGWYCVPLSIPAPAADDIGYLLPDENQSEFVQLTRTDAAEMTEWVRYDTIQSSFGQLVRDEAEVLARLYLTLTTGGTIDDFQGSPSDPPGGGQGGDGPGGGGGGGGSAYSSGPAPPPVAPAAEAVAQGEARRVEGERLHTNAVVVGADGEEQTRSESEVVKVRDALQLLVEHGRLGKAVEREAVQRGLAYSRHEQRVLARGD